MCVYITGLLEKNIYNFEEKANRKIDEEKKHIQLGNNKLLSIAAREEERKRRKGGVGRVGGRRKRRGMRGVQTREKKFEGWRMYIYILYTHSMTDLHAIVVNSFVS